MTSRDARIELEDAMAAPAAPAPRAGAATVVPPGHSRRCRSGLRRPSSSSGQRATGSEGRRSRRRRILASSVSRIFPASRSLPPFHQTASRWRSPPAWAANDSSSCSSLLAARRCKSRAIQSITSTLAGRPTRARSSIFRRRYQETVQGSIWEIPALGGVPRRVVNSVGGADVSPTDGRLALFRLAKEGIQLVTAPTDGSRFDVVAEFAPATYYLYPRWSPDGRWIAFQRGDSVRFDVFVAPAAGGEPRQLTHDNNMMSGFAWLPDSTGIVYSSSRGGTMPYLPTLGLWQVTLRDGSVRRRHIGRDVVRESGHLQEWRDMWSAA